VAGSFGTEVTEAKAREMLDDFAKQLASGKIILFLSNVTCIELWLWEYNAVEPKLIKQVHKTFVKKRTSWGGRRLPPWVSDDSRKCYKALAAQLLEMDDDLRDHYFSLVSQAEVTTRSLSGKPRQWLVTQRFDTSADLSALIVRCRTVPIVSVALPYEGTVRGRAFCFLPIGDIFTGLPVHLNACFHVTKDRRGLWMKDATSSSLGRVGNQIDYAEWNQVLLTDALPRLWKEALEAMAENVRSPPFSKYLNLGSFITWVMALMYLLCDRKGRAMKNIYLFFFELFFFSCLYDRMERQQLIMPC